MANSTPEGGRIYCKVRLSTNQAKQRFPCNFPEEEPPTPTSATAEAAALPANPAAQGQAAQPWIARASLAALFSLSGLRSDAPIRTNG